MKKVAILLFSLLILSSAQSQTIVSVSNGNWTNPMTWGGNIPTPGSDITVMHDVAMDIDWAVTGSLTVNSAGKISSATPSRALAINNGSLTVHGILEIPRIAILGGQATSYGQIISDSLFCNVNLSNFASASINAEQLMIGSGGMLVNMGSVSTNNFLNLSIVTNSGYLTANDLLNTSTFNNSNGAVVSISHDCMNADTNSSPAVLTNDGEFNVFNDWQNTGQVNGSGKFCVVNNSHNSGILSGSFDFCDLSGGNFDLNTGTIGPSITFCTSPCPMSIEEENEVQVSVFPNPSSGFFSIEIENNEDYKINVYSVLGKQVLGLTNNGGLFNIDLNKEVPGIYFLEIRKGTVRIHSKRLIIQ